MKNYKNEEIKYSGCPSCSYAKHQFELPCGMAYENDNLILSQDWELPIPGFMVVSPKKHIENFEELNEEERHEIFDLINKTIIILRNNNVCDRFDVIFEEKENRHFHIWIMPRYEWMKKVCNSVTKNIGIIQDYAINNLRKKDIYDRIIEVSNIVKEQINSK